jgi:hypothetical protein
MFGAQNLEGCKEFRFVPNETNRIRYQKYQYQEKQCCLMNTKMMKMALNEYHTTLESAHRIRKMTRASAFDR